MMINLPLVDSHLDLAENATIFGRDLTLSAAEIRALEKRTSRQATVSLPELCQGGIAVVIATVTPGFLDADVGEDFTPQSGIYHTPEEAEAQALKQIALYERWEKEDLIRLVKSRNDLDDHLRLWQNDRLPGLVLLMESADPILQVGDLPGWWKLGLRMVGLTFGDTRFGAGVAGGSMDFEKGGLTPDGLALLDKMGELGMIWDISHLSDAGIWQGLDAGFYSVCASHANARRLTLTNRHLSDDVIAAVGKKGGVIGLVLYNGFLDQGWSHDHSLPVTLEQHLRRQVEYVAAVAGWDHVGIGSDLDGGFGLEECPQEIDTVADLHRIGAVLPPERRAAVLSENWLSFLTRSLP